MYASSRAYKAAFLTFLALSTWGCTHYAILQRPRAQADIELEGQAGPYFEWKTSQILMPYGYYYDYKLVVALDRQFRSPVIERNNLESPAYEITDEDGFLVGGKTYHWKVDGYVRDPDGEVWLTLKCKAPRSFFLKKRDTVDVQIRVPDGFELRIDDEVYDPEQEDAEKRRKGFGFFLENGERRDIQIRSKERITIRGREVDLVVIGEIWVERVNENTKWGTITINNIDQAKLIDIGEGNVGDFSYELGGEKIVGMKLGGKKDGTANVEKIGR